MPLKPSSLASSTSRRRASAEGAARERIGPVILGEHQTQEGRYAVEDEPAVLDLDPAQSKIAFHRVGHFSVGVDQFDLGVDQIGVLWGPQQIVPALGSRVDIELQVAPQLITLDHAAVVDQSPARLVTGEADAHAPALGRWTVEANDQLDSGPIDVGRPAQFRNRGPRDRLEPHRLPDPGGPMIPDVSGALAPILLAARLLKVVRAILGADHDHLRAIVVQQWGDVGMERGMTALMLDGQTAVDPYRRFIVDGSKVEPQAGAPQLYIRIKLAPVPDDGVKAGVPHSRQLGLRRIRHPDFSAEPGRVFEPAFGKAAILVIERETPLPAQVLPGRPAKLRARVDFCGTGRLHRVDAQVIHARPLSRMGERRKHPG